MPQSYPNNPDLQAAVELLRGFICLTPHPTPSPADNDLPDPARVRKALVLVANHSDYQIFGICADSATQAAAALEAYLLALDYEAFSEFSPVPAELDSITGPVYIKFNPKTGKFHIDSYTGEHRGVLVSCQSAYDGDVNETFGHLPLGLFER